MISTSPRTRDTASARPSDTLDFPVPRPHETSPAALHSQRLTMPPGALARVFAPLLRVLAQRTQPAQGPFELPLAAILFAGDHACAHVHGLSAFPSAVTAQMVLNFLSGGAAMSVLARRRGAPLYVCDVGVATPYARPGNARRDDGSVGGAGSGPDARVPEADDRACYFDENLAGAQTGYPFGAHDASERDALDGDTYARAFEAGERVFARVHAKTGCAALLLGEMGIGNTTAAAAITAQCLGLDPVQCVGRGTGVDDAALDRKRSHVRASLARHAATHGADAHHPDHVLASLGGFELAALAGAACAAARAGVHLIVDGSIATAALLPHARAHPNLKLWYIAAHRGAEPGHHHALEALGLSPLLSLDLRLGEGSGAALAMGLVQDALALLNDMATFESAGVSDRDR